jgi:hypothetical protein
VDKYVKSEHGMALVGTLMVVIILGVMVSIAISINPQPSATVNPNTPLLGTTTTLPKTIASGAQEAAVAACETNYLAILTAVDNYRAENGSAPPAGHLWATSSTHGGPFIQSWPAYSQYYNLIWNGDVLSVTPFRGAASHGTFGAASPASGCYAA